MDHLKTYIFGFLNGNFLFIIFFLLTLISILKIWKIFISKRGKCSKTFNKNKDYGVFIGLIIGIFGMTLIIVGFFLPIYKVEAEIKTISSPERVEDILIVFGGWNGLQINMSSIDGTLLMPSFNDYIRMFFILSIWFSIIGLVEIKKAKNVGSKLIWGGLLQLALLAAPLIFISRIDFIIESLSEDVRMALTPLALDVMREISLNPFLGTHKFTIPGLNIDASWGIDMGYYVFVVAGMIKIIGGIILRRC